MKICSNNINLSLEAKHIDKKSNFKSNVKQNNKLLSINSKNNKNAGSTIAEMMKQKQQLKEDIIDLQKKQEEYELKIKTEIEEIQKQITGLEDDKKQIIKENIDDIDTLNEVSHRLNEKDKNKDKDLEDNNKVGKDREKELEDKKNETIEKFDKENKVQASNEDEEILHKLLNKVKNNSKQGAKDLKEIQKQIQDLKKQIDKLKADLKSSQENTQKEIESIQKEVNNLNKKSKEYSLSGNIVDEYI